MLENYEYNPKIAYGDTDSIFIDMQFKHKTLDKIKNKELIEISIRLGKIIQTIFGETIFNQETTQNLVLRYEKCLVNLFILKKKKYVGWVYENSTENRKLFMTGIVLKRKDNAEVVKIIYK